MEDRELLFADNAPLPERNAKPPKNPGPKHGLLHVDGLVKAEDTVPFQNAINAFWHLERASRRRCGWVVGCICDQHQSGGLDRINQCRDQILKLVSVLELLTRGSLAQSGWLSEGAYQ